LYRWVVRQQVGLADGTLPLDCQQGLADIGCFDREPAVIEKTVHDEGSGHNFWGFKYDDLLLFRKRLGHCYLPHPWPEQPGLGIWVQAQRREHEAATLSPEHIARLDDMQFIWTGGGEVLGEDWPHKQKEVMGFFYHDPEKQPEHYYLHARPPGYFDEFDDDF
jgi:hypothetical protein